MPFYTLLLTTLTQFSPPFLPRGQGIEQALLAAEEPTSGLPHRLHSALPLGSSAQRTGASPGFANYQPEHKSLYCSVGGTQGAATANTTHSAAPPSLLPGAPSTSQSSPHPKEGHFKVQTKQQLHPRKRGCNTSLKRGWGGAADGTQSGNSEFRTLQSVLRALSFSGRSLNSRPHHEVLTGDNTL